MPAAAVSLLLFVPADRPERFLKAASAGADAVIIDLEDAVAPAAKPAARAGLSPALATLPDTIPIFLRINGVGTPWHAADLDAATALPVAGIVLPKTESSADLNGIRKRFGPASTLIALVETARGLANIDEIAGAADGIAFGSVDFAADLGCAHSREPLLLARGRIVLAARLAGLPAPIEGVTLSIEDEVRIEGDARYGAAMGFGGKLLIHPAQVDPARRGLSPGADDIGWAERIIARAGDGGAKAVDGIIIDAPVIARARNILRVRDRFLNRTRPDENH